ncbi:uncharacterized protein LOC129752751 [Uranotaenia lowii]|uniref:uncharacterized protein LOC129752751 n=1 Tax=Uranotaenia lowii TaxID=190385 RepID=UPI0024798811|nr:uncharacterized protein LOC129752751 [Uranotaenia lowii]
MECENHDNGASVGGGTKAPNMEKKNSKSKIRRLEQALAAEKTQKDELLSKLKKARRRNKMFLESHGEPSTPRHSTMREEYQGHNFNEASFSLSSSINNLSFASLSVPECKPVSDDGEIDKKTFNQWKDHLESSMLLTGISDEFTKMNVFRIRAGRKLLDVLDNTKTNFNTPDITTAPYSNAMHRLCSYFGSREYAFMQREKLRTMTQNKDEPDFKYVKRIIEAAKVCDFDENRLVESVTDVIQFHATNAKVREVARKILRKGGSYIDLLDKVRSIEVEKMHESIYATHSNQVKQVEVAAITQQPQRSGFGNNRGGYRGGYRGGFRYNRGGIRSTQPNPGHSLNNRIDGNNGYMRTLNFQRSAYNRTNWSSPETSQGFMLNHACWRCTSKFHEAHECSARFKVCRSCNEEGHLERVCPGSSSTSRSDFNKSGGPQSKIPKIAAVSMYEDEKIVEDNNVGSRVGSVGCFALEKTDEIITGYIAGVPISFLIDSGAEVNTISDSNFKFLMNHSIRLA